MVHHLLSKGVHKWIGLRVQIPKHFIRLPSSHKRRNCGIDFGTKKSHGTTSSKAPGRDLGRRDTGDVVEWSS
jgi:hypothetical protein